MGDQPTRRGVELRVAYDGTDFVGWQKQPDQRTVQGALEAAVEAMTGAAVTVRGASRTDAGVHAEDQVAAFDTALEVPLRGWVMGLNQKLPPDVAVRAARPCPRNHQPRFDARWKRYRYVLLTGDVPDPLLRRVAWHLGPHQRPAPGGEPDAPGPADARVRLDLGAMRAAAAHLVGTHDFRAFSAVDDARENRVRTVTRVDVLEGFRDDPRLVALVVEGTAFLKHMVRIVAGTLVDVGRGHRTPEDVARAVGPGAVRTMAGPTAPPQGLTLVRIQTGRVAAARP